MFKLPTLLILSSLLSGCLLSGDIIPPDETTTVRKTNEGLCFVVPDPSDYRPATLEISSRATSTGTRFFRTMPALDINKDTLCIPESYYSFPDNGEFIIRYSLRSPTKENKRRFVVSVVEMVNGEPHSLMPRHDEAPLLTRD